MAAPSGISPVRFAAGALVTFSRRNPTLLALLGLAGAIVALYARTLSGYFLADDFANVAGASRFPLARWPLLFVRDVYEGTWSVQLLRPFAALTGIVQARLFGTDPTGYHIVSLAFHVLNAALVYALARRTSAGSRALAFAAALLFAVHPMHAEAVAWIPGQSDLIPTALLLAAMLAFLLFRETGRMRHVFSVVLLAALAVFTKENSVVLLPLLLVYDALQFRTFRIQHSLRDVYRAILPHIGLLVVLALYFLCRRLAFGGGGGVPSTQAVASTLSETLPAKYFQYMAYLLTPLNLETIASKMTAASASQPHLAVLSWAAALLLLPAIAVAGIRRQFQLLRWILFFGPVWFVLVSAPFLFTYNYPRHAYLLSAGFCVCLVAVAKALVPDRWWAFRAVIIGALACVWSAANVKTVDPWRETGIISRNMHRTIRRLASKPAGSVLLLDLPGAIRGAHLFHWSSPFLVQPPFCQVPLTQRFIVLEAPTSYYDPTVWSRHAAIEQITGIPDATAVYFVDYDGARGGRSRKLSAVKTRAAAADLRAALAADPQTPVDVHWRRFVDSAR